MGTLDQLKLLNGLQLFPVPSCLCPDNLRLYLKALLNFRAPRALECPGSGSESDL